MEGSRSFRNEVLPSQDESVFYSDPHLSNGRNYSIDASPSLTMVSSEESSDSLLNEATSMESSSQSEVAVTSVVPEAAAAPRRRDAPPSKPKPRTPRPPRMIVDVDAYMEDDSEEEDPLEKEEKEDLYGKTVVMSNCKNLKSDEEDPYAKTVVISNVTQSSRLDEEDEEVPSPTASPKRTSSQKAAVNAVLGYDVDADYDFDDYNMKLCKKTQLAHDYGSPDRTAELTDDELAAVVPPTLRRHASSINSTPGAFSVHGSGVVSVAPTAALTCDTDAEDPMMGQPQPPTLIAATLVDPMASYSSMDEHYHKDSPTLVFAEPLWWKRRLVLCISGWMLLALGIVTLVATLTFRLTKEESNANSSESTSNPPIPSTLVTNVPTLFPTAAPSSAPTVFPVTRAPQTFAPGSSVAYHAVSWGMVSTCTEDENSVFYSNALSIRCGDSGVLEIHNFSDGVACDSYLDFTGKTDCQLNQMTEEWSYILNGNATQATGLVLFSCRGSSEEEWTATTQLQEVPVLPNCSTLVSTTTKPLASNFVSLGRFCFESGQKWAVRQEVYQCQGGVREVIPKFRKNRRHLLSFSDLLQQFASFLGITSFCYNERSCSGPDCIVLATVMNDNDSTCVVSDEGLLPPDLEVFWQAAQIELEPSKRMDALIAID